MSNEPDSRRPRRPWGRRIGVLAVVLALIGVGAGWLYDRAAERPRVLAAIEAAGGKYHISQSFYLWVIARTLRATNDGGYDVLLKGPEFDDAWLAKQHGLRSIPIRDLMLIETNLSHESVMQLFDRNWLTTFNAPGVRLTDSDAQQIGERDGLTHLNLMQTQLSDAGLSALRPQRLRVLNVAGTRVTSAALQHELAGAQLQYLFLDGEQLTPELAAQLSQLKSLNMISLIGPDVTDAHVKLLEGMPNVTYYRLDQTSVSEAAVDRLRSAKPKTQVDVLDAEPTFIKWRKE